MVVPVVAGLIGLGNLPGIVVAQKISQVRFDSS